MSTPVEQAAASSRDRILEVALAEFASHGYSGARLQDIGGAAGLTHPTLLYHFESKQGLYEATVRAAVDDWAAEVREAISVGLEGFEQIASLVTAAFHFFETHEDFVRVLRREAIEGGERLGGATAEVLGPFLEEAVEFLEREMEAGRLRLHDPIELMQLCYGAVFTHFSDARFRERVLGNDPLQTSTLRHSRDSLIELLRGALEPRASSPGSTG